MNVKAVRDEDGQILLFEGSIEDISRRIHAEWKMNGHLFR
jgi:hypothetical protein